MANDFHEKCITELVSGLDNVSNESPSKTSIAVEMAIAVRDNFHKNKEPDLRCNIGMEYNQSQAYVPQKLEKYADVMDHSSDDILKSYITKLL